ncbi:hypothetical protein FPOA_20713 [Fusarium poae]|uniref:RNA-directed DNA polymerase n=1 Tax=Fusarium poae TaxID=36050 RepID=A0A1B8ARE8_FUSPO|nr:hypothetical protein FPOA_28288 [Fusarium poae]OBS15825.1 hypothetical protein FPOA_28059 [Fusarium poae]OBS15875.1 hypothetical protein FPOA_28002 [Fusarium poae]OBS16899.1 hypothetical protein FPOA_26985 [Fusarium poae]OBS17443.1 hypothetical protein FPOA_26430 [Fusarium poae]
MSSNNTNNAPAPPYTGPPPSTAEMMAELQLLRNTVRTLQARVTELPAVAPPVNPVDNQRDLGEVIKPTPPEPFKGKAADVIPFLTRMKGYFRLFPRKLDTAAKKMLYTAPLIQGDAKDWFEPIWKDYLENEYNQQDQETQNIFADWLNFEALLKDNFGVINEERQAAAEILALKQHGSCAAHSAKFRQLAAKTEWDDEALMEIYYRSLKEEVKDELYKADRPDNLTEYITMAVKIDERQYERRKEKSSAGRKGSNYNPYYPNQHNRRNQTTGPRNGSNQGGTQQNDTSYGSHSGPMTIGATRAYRPPTCWNCGRKGHKETDCYNPVKTNQKYRPVPEGRNVRNTNLQENEAQMAIRTTRRTNATTQVTRKNWQPVPEHPTMEQQGSRIAVTRRGKSAPDTGSTKQAPGSNLHDQKIGNIPVRTTRPGSNLHYEDPNFVSARQATKELDNERAIEEWRQNTRRDPDRRDTPNPQELRLIEQENARDNQLASEHQEELSREHRCPHNEQWKRQQPAVLVEPQHGDESRRVTTTPSRALRTTKNGQRTCLELKVRIRGTWLTALVDSGADVNAIDPRTVNRLKLPWKDKTHPYPMRNLEGQLFDYEGGLITREIDHLKMFVRTRRQNIDLDIIPTPGHDLMLGYPWLQRYNPHVDWRTGQISGYADPSDDEAADSETDDELRSQTSTDTHGEERREQRIHPPPNGVRHKQAQGRARRVRRTLASFGNQLRTLNERLEQQPETTDRLRNVPEEYRIYDRLFKEELDTKVPQHSRWDHEICLTSDELPFQKIYNLNEMELTTLKEYLEEELRKGNIRESSSAAGFPVMFVPKKNGKLRLVVDYRRLNALTIKDRTPLPLITELKDRLQGKQVFTALDLKGAYNLIRIKEGDEWKTAFRTKFGLFEYLVMPFGLTNAPATFQRMINNVLRQYLDVFVVCYLDDILIFSDNDEEHKEHVHKVLKALQDANLLVEPEKSHFHVTEVDFLGHTISPGEIRMDRKKIAAVRDWPIPTTVKEVQSFLGFANYYRRFIRDFSKIANPLTELTKKDRKFVWIKDAQDAFERLRDAILEEPVLIMFDPTKEIELETDSSDFALGGQIGQRDDNGKLHPIAFYSHKLHGAELNYPIYDKEFLAIVNCFKEFRHYLMGSLHQIKVYTDHQNISHFATTQELNRRQLRYAEYLCEFDFTIIHRKGSDNGRADAISRRPDYDTGITKAKEQVLELNGKGEYQFTQPARTIARTMRGTPDPGDHEDQEQRKQTVREIHEHPLHGHQGVTKTLKRLQSHYDWPNMRRLVETVIKQCDVCMRTKSQRHKPYGTLQALPVAQRPWDSITMDFITKLPLSEEPSTGIFYDSIMVIVDRLTKFSYYLPYREATDAEELAYVFYRHVVSIHGLPREILSDRGPTFAAKFWQALMSHLGLNHRLTTAFRPQADGQTERMNQVLEQYLRCYINYEQNDWVEKLPVAQLAYNTAYNESTRLTPAYANFGFTPDSYHAARETPTINPAAQIKAEDMKNLHEEMKKELEFVRKRMTKYYNTKRIERPTFKEGEMVYLSTKNITTKRPTHKLDFKFIGPYKILRKISENNYELDLPPKVRIHPIFHISLLESAADTIQVKIGNEPEEIDGPETYEAEAIRDMQKIDGKTMYLVKWKNYPENENTWEPPKHLINAQRLLKNFHQPQGRKNRERNSSQ